MAKEVQTDLLIALVEAHPVLWDKTSIIYKNRKQTKQAWTEVCNELNRDLNNYTDEKQKHFTKGIMKRWVNIRDAYHKSLKKDKSGSGASSAKNYVYSEQLKFLDKLFCPLTREDSLSDYFVDHKDLEVDASQADSTHNNSDSGMPPRKQLDSRRIKLDDVEMKTLQDFEQPDDRHIWFFKGIIPSLSSFTEDETLQFQMGVLKLIQSIKQSR